ncbi:MAG TPA: XRE family transcriptional regulator [Actinophytocola sp.]|uniref:XRE family transcriptional regulator n=1 Tax=Actinophytocola sp. TaxID=1872138 RepID=UPI002DDC9447|nr:XRE family transcriptional regulator [Actinophytocola sp.]HEV2781403.1 XRE family transcriptional regulator [Actinophytocola sp.]
MSRRQWLHVRRHLIEHRHRLAVSAADAYPTTPKINGLLTAPGWLPAAPVRLDAIAIELTPDTPFHGTTGTESALPVGADGTRYPSYAAAMADLAAPAVFEDRPTYRLLAASPGRLTFGRGTYFDSINTGEAAAHEYAAADLDPNTRSPLRDAIGDPCDLRRRPTNVAISTLTLRHDRSTDHVTFFLHWRDPAKVAHAGGLYQVVPVGIFQPTRDDNSDFNLWRSILRELAEELRGDPEHPPLDYTAPFATTLTNSLGSDVHAFYLGLGVDPLTFATDLLTAVIIDAPLFDALFGTPTTNTEGTILKGLPFTHETITHFTHHQPLQAAGAALLTLALTHRTTLIPHHH